MGRVARTAAAVAVPEAAAARKIVPGMSPGQVDDELQRRRAAAQARRAQRASAPGHPMVPATAPAAEAPPPTSSGGGFSAPALPMPAAAATGSGFALGVVAWAVGLAYLKYGWAGVRQFGAAKFFNKPGGLR
jgi:hypothetical protein